MKVERLLEETSKSGMSLIDAELNPENLVGARQHRGPSKQMEQQRSQGEVTENSLFHIWLSFQNVLGRDEQLELRDEQRQGPGQCQDKEFTLYLESNEEQCKVLGKVLIYQICLVEKIFCLQCG